jgi:hypothetical protein
MGRFKPVEMEFIKRTRLQLPVPEYSDWHCELFGGGEAMVMTPIKGNEPNFFWRWMQYLCFGNRWRRGDHGV